MYRSSVARNPEPGQHHCLSESGSFFGLDVEQMKPRAQVAVALAVLVPVLLSGLILVVFVPKLWWIFTTYGWISFPAFVLLIKGITGTMEQKPSPVNLTEERELLEALREHGELTPMHAAMQTSLSVTEADRKLQELAEGGHLEVRVRGGAIFYAPWEDGTGRSIT